MADKQMSRAVQLGKAGHNVTIWWASPREAFADPGLYLSFVWGETVKQWRVMPLRAARRE